MSATPGLKRCVALYKMNRHGPSLEQMRLAYEELHGCSIRRPQSTCEVRKEFLAVALDALSNAIAMEGGRQGGIVTQQTVELPIVELKPCPLCGTAIERDYYGEDDWSYSHGAAANECVLQGLHFGEEHVASWNTRSKDNLIKEAVEALTEIAKGAGPFNRDPLIHAENTIEHMKETALECIAKLTGEKQ